MLAGTGTNRDVGTYSTGGGTSRLLVQHKSFGGSPQTTASTALFDQYRPGGSLGGLIDRPGDGRYPLQIHRESNEYASIWEWPPIPGDQSLPAGTSAVAGDERGGARATTDSPPPPLPSQSHGYYGTYETRQQQQQQQQQRQLSSDVELQQASSCRRIEHPYQYPLSETPSGPAAFPDSASRRYYALHGAAGTRYYGSDAQIATDKTTAGCFSGGGDSSSCSTSLATAPAMSTTGHDVIARSTAGTTSHYDVMMTSGKPTV